jgi:Pao retrotransposon peptidase.
LKNDFYVDDLVSGADNLGAACIIQDQLNDVLLTGGFTLRKWIANCSQLIDRIPSHLQQQALRHFSENDQVSALGLLWNPTTDQFQFKMRISPLSVPLTKRKILSTIAQLFDPLGWLAPVVVQAKILLQQLWLARVDWDSALPGHIENQWTKYYQELPGIESSL